MLFFLFSFVTLNNTNCHCLLFLNHICHLFFFFSQGFLHGSGSTPWFQNWVSISLYKICLTVLCVCVCLYAFTTPEKGRNWRWNCYVQICYSPALPSPPRTTSFTTVTAIWSSWVSELWIYLGIWIWICEARNFKKVHFLLIVMYFLI